ncbi:FAD-dependent oxidoreductase [Streptomyces sp. NBC_01264]|uniref:FAD-dependent oxidoreductase n=1 Tax=Streptomyces sp. NBC_01264 TaxID=2903804 RepID=UPI002253AFB7|nr:FAD-dependent oxidoreductase [Streptomyces sp. NBC_01264]MCX4779729.1 FAD-dependent oxidoreductase [Streptomyces sp. NBC_01264]
MSAGEVLVVGNGPAANRFVERLHHHGHRGGVTVLGAEHGAAYNRVLLTSVLDGTLPPGALTLPAPPPGTRLHTGVTVTRIDRARRLAHTRDGAAHPYDTLVLATGARPALPEIPGLTAGGASPGSGVLALRTLADAERIARTPPQSAVVLGAGLLGVEAAAALRRAGHDVALVHRGPHPLDRRLDSVAGTLLTRRLEGMGVEVHADRRAAEHHHGKLVLDDGSVLAADLVLLCTGAEPDTRLARRAGLTVRSGVVVDDLLRTDDPRIHAIGDCSEHPGDTAGHLEPAWEQAETLAGHLAGVPVRRRGTRQVTRLRIPGLDLVQLGRGGRTTEVEAGDNAGELVTFTDPARGRYARLTLHGERITEAVLLGLPRAIAAVTRLHALDLPVPSGRLELLLGTAPATADAEELPDEAVVCRCNNVTKHTLAEACRAGAHDLPSIAAVTRATTGCGGCTDAVRALCGTFRPPEGTDTP